MIGKAGLDVLIRIGRSVSLGKFGGLGELILVG